VLEPGSLVLLFSDGLVERRGELLEHGLARLARAARDSVDLPVETVCDRVLGELGVPSHGDDVVLVVLRTAVTAQPVFRHAFPSRPEELRIARDAARNWLEQHGVLGRRAHDVVLALGEACANAVEHAYRGGTGEGEGEVEVEISGTAADLLLSVRDRGRWRVPAADGDRGRGTSIMQALASELRVDTTEGGTTVTIRFHEPEAVTA
jgi:anti-sigma regulatory factor (Ser/Thr protein kinase)